MTNTLSTHCKHETCNVHWLGRLEGQLFWCWLGAHRWMGRGRSGTKQVQTQKQRCRYCAAVHKHNDMEQTLQADRRTWRASKTRRDQLSTRWPSRETRQPHFRLVLLNQAVHQASLFSAAAWELEGTAACCELQRLLLPFEAGAAFRRALFGSRRGEP